MVRTSQSHFWTQDGTSGECVRLRPPSSVLPVELKDSVVKKRTCERVDVRKTETRDRTDDTVLDTDRGLL